MKFSTGTLVLEHVFRGRTETRHSSAVNLMEGACARADDNRGVRRPEMDNVRVDDADQQERQQTVDCSCSRTRPTMPKSSEPPRAVISRAINRQNPSHDGQHRFSLRHGLGGTDDLDPQLGCATHRISRSIGRSHARGGTATSKSPQLTRSLDSPLPSRSGGNRSCQLEAVRRRAPPPADAASSSHISTEKHMNTFMTGVSALQSCLPHQSRARRFGSEVFALPGNSTVLLQHRAVQSSHG
jgi:hypothetical protein